MMKPNLDKVRDNVARSTTEDLLDRATVYRAGMEPEALEVIDAELRSRGVSEAEVAAHVARHQGPLDAHGLPLMCSCSPCRRPAVTVVWDWHWLFGLLPIFPERRPLCAEHAPPGWNAERREERRTGSGAGAAPEGGAGQAPGGDDHFFPNS
jgi:hypothetical protein